MKIQLPMKSVCSVGDYVVDLFPMHELQNFINCLAYWNFIVLINSHSYQISHMRQQYNYDIEEPVSERIMHGCIHVVNFPLLLPLELRYREYIIHFFLRNKCYNLIGIQSMFCNSFPSSSFSSSEINQMK